MPVAASNRYSRSNALPLVSVFASVSVSVSVSPPLWSFAMLTIRSRVRHRLTGTVPCPRVCSCSTGKPRSFLRPGSEVATYYTFCCSTYTYLVKKCWCCTRRSPWVANPPGFSQCRYIHRWGLFSLRSCGSWPSFGTDKHFRRVRGRHVQRTRLGYVGNRVWCRPLMLRALYYGIPYSLRMAGGQRQTVRLRAFWRFAKGGAAIRGCVCVWG
ncbi:hypothetical protein LXA43DRAFT_125052 [Ganoderma leucocontextum]|nr:hypothetical protein LXA43DRAFT_125052 [Ganoderma leucocontextum]